MKFNNVEKIKKQLCKKGAVIGAVGLLLLAGGSTTVMAGSTVSGTLDGYSCSGRIETNRDEAIATTTYARSNSGIYAKAYVYYWSGSKNYYSYESASSKAGGVAAVAKKQIGGADVVGGRGVHSVYYGSYSWRPSGTETGKIPPEAEEK